MILKTYGVENLVDWKAQIPVGKAKVIVHFSGGAMTRIGVTPAEYSTSNPMIQHVIENSEHYRSGKILLLRTMEVPDDAATKARKNTEANRAMRKVADEALIVDDVEETTMAGKPALPEGDFVQAGKPALPEGDFVQAGKPALPEGDFVQAGKPALPEGLTEVEVSCLQDAQEYLKENFNVPTTSIRSYEKAQAAAGEHGVVFVGGKF